MNSVNESPSWEAYSCLDNVLWILITRAHHYTIILAMLKQSISWQNVYWTTQKSCKGNDLSTKFSTLVYMLHLLPISCLLIERHYNVWRQEQIMNVFIIEFSPVFDQFLALRPNVLAVHFTNFLHQRFPSVCETKFHTRMRQHVKLLL